MFNQTTGVIGTIEKDRVKRTIVYPTEIKVDMNDLHDTLFPFLSENCGCLIKPNELEIWGTRWKDTLPLYEAAVEFLNFNKYKNDNTKG